MAELTKEKALEIAYKRNLLPLEQKKAYEIAIKRGLVTFDDETKAQTIEQQPQQEESDNQFSLVRQAKELQKPKIKEFVQSERPQIDKQLQQLRPNNLDRLLQDFKEPFTKEDWAKTLLNIASFTPTPGGITATAGRFAPIGLKTLAKFGAQTIPQAAAGAGVTYLGQREKGVLRGESGIDAALGFGLELTSLAGQTVAGKALGYGAKQFTKKLPKDLISKAIQYGADKGKTAEQRIRQIIRLGKKARANNKKIGTELENFANKADKVNKNIAKLTATKLKDANRKFHNDNKDKSKLITKIKDKDIENFIREEYRRLKKAAEPLIEGGQKKVREAEEKVLKDFEKRFFLEPQKVTETQINQLGIPITRTVIKKGARPFKNRQEIFRELRNIQENADGAFKEGATEKSALYRDIYTNFSEFFKQNSKKYRDHMNVGQDLARMKDAKLDFPITKDGEILGELYNAEKIKRTYDEAIEKFDKLPDQDKFLVIKRLVEQSNKLFKTEYKLGRLLKQWEKNQNRMLLKGAKKGLTEKQKNLLPNKIKKIYENNQELSKVTEKGLFTDNEKLQKFIKGKEGVLSETKLAQLLPKRLVNQLEIEAAGRLLREGIDINKIPIGVIGSPYLRAANLVKRLGVSPRAQFGIRRFMESDIPGQIGEGARALSRVLSRELVRDDEQKTDVIRHSETNEPVIVKREPNQLERTTSGNLTIRQKNDIKKQRGLGGNN